ncbi:MAG TPA: hypothetical protein VKK79_16700 [Candidatus Lokiarchaeia archaeon]|nr:hypothetical protein [Candidatus Lokiarchaeia archaeon]
MIYSIALISTTGYPFYQGNLTLEPVDIDLKLYFFEYGRNLAKEETVCIDEITSFELNAGLISALCEFARLLKRPITGLLFKYTGQPVNNQCEDDVTSSKLTENDIGTIASVRCDSYNNLAEVKKKVDIVWDHYVQKYAPFGPDKNFDPEDAVKIKDILNDRDAKEKLNTCYEDIRNASENFLEEMHSYGVESIIITTHDFSPVYTFGDLTIDEAGETLRNIGEVPVVGTYDWNYRFTSFVRGKEIKRFWNFIINSGAGVTVEGLFMPYYYMLLCQPGASVAEVPQRYYTLINKFLD